MSLRLYNTLTQSVEEFAPADGKTVRMYTCGPTVHNFAHIGNLRTFTFEDVLRRWLHAHGYQTDHVMNITDVDDKIIRKAAAAHKTIQEYTAEYTQAFLEDTATLRLERPERLVKATEHISEMAAAIHQLEEKGFTYNSEGSVYYSIQKFPEYGKLSHADFSGARAGARVDVDEYDKADARDIHCGGVDLIFPHHENEIAQSEALSGKPFSRFWLHSEFLNIDSQKMAKSAGNFYTLRDLLAMGHAPEAVRYLLISVPYRKKLNFTFDGLQAAATAIDRLRNFKLRLDTEKFAPGCQAQLDERASAAIKQFDDSLDDDLNTAEALAAIFEFVRDVNTAMDNGEFREDNVAGARRVLDRFDSIADVLTPSKQEAGGIADDEVEKLIAERHQAKKARNFARADELRNQLNEAGIILEDTKDGARWKRK